MGNTGTNKQYNGNIAYQYYGTPGNLNKNYTYTYDNLNRLTNGTSSDSFNESGITYDVMGNITALNRYQSGTLIDQLGYTYSSTNQVQSIADGSGSNTGLVNGTTTYSYDGNGNMVSNANTVNTAQNKSFTYNLLNLPMVATVSNGTASYTYDAAGNKLRKVSVINGVTTTTEYISGIQYKNSTTAVDFIQTEEGKAVNNSGSYDYNYNLGDNLGNTRVTFGTKTGSAVLYQQDDYYPFGMEISRSVTSPKNEYLYNKKELQEEFGQYDYGARFYDPVVGRWTTIDPKAEIDRRWSPYVYGFNNGIRFEDPDGMSAIDQYDIYADGSITVQRDNKTTNSYTYHEKSGATTDLGTFDRDPKTNLTNLASNLDAPSSGAPFHLNGDVAAGVLGAAHDYQEETGRTAQFTQMTDAGGKHSGHGGDLGGYADARYANKNGDKKDEGVTTKDSNFDKANSQKLADSFKKFGFDSPTSILTENATNTGPALNNTHYTNGAHAKRPFTHNNHMHLQHYNKSHIKDITK